MTLTDKILVLRPTWEFDREFTVRRNEGVYTVEWNVPEQDRPTQAEMDAITQEQVDDYNVDLRMGQKFEADKALKALIIWIADKTNTPPAQMRDELKAIYKTL